MLQIKAMATIKGIHKEVKVGQRAFWILGFLLLLKSLRQKGAKYYKVLKKLSMKLDSVTIN